MANPLFDVTISGGAEGYVTGVQLKLVLDRMGEILSEELESRDAEIRRLRSELDTERRLRLGMRSR